MENGLTLFDNSEFGKVRFLEVEGKPYAIGIDVAKALGYINPNHAITRHCKGCLKRAALTNGGIQQFNVIPEGDIYRLIVNSELPSAEKFERWVFDEVLPSIRKTGGYIPASTEDTEEEILAKAMVIAQKTLELQKKRIAELQANNAEQSLLIEEQKPLVEFSEKLLKSKDNILVREFAKIMQDENIIDFGEKKLYAWLRREGLLSDTNEPYQKYMNYFTVKENVIETPFGNRLTKTTLVTPKGQLYLYSKLKEEFTGGAWNTQYQLGNMK